MGRSCRSADGRVPQRRCAVCHHGFVPDPRVGERQKLCRRVECRKAHRESSQAAWRTAHPGYFVEWRARRRAKAAARDVVEPPRLPDPLSRLPWEFAQEEFGPGGADFLASMGRLLVQHAKDERRSQVAGFSSGTPKVEPSDAKFERHLQGLGSTGESSQVAPQVAKAERSPLPASAP